jgi:hypothetical protein
MKLSLSVHEHTHTHTYIYTFIYKTQTVFFGLSLGITLIHNKFIMFRNDFTPNENDSK